MTLDQRTLHELLRYEADTGRLFYKPRPSKYFSNAQSMSRWNNRHAGAEAFLQTTRKGYRSGKVLGITAVAHRIIWVMAFGRPASQIDHMNGDKTDNRLVNLRAVSVADNQRNRPRQRNNSSGFNGVALNRRLSKYQAFITLNRKRHHLGTFDSAEAAFSARKDAEKAFGFFKNHGREQ